MQSAKPRPGQYVFLNTPTGRRWQYHPVTVADVDESQPGLALVTAHMKCYGNWTTVRPVAILQIENFCQLCVASHLMPKTVGSPLTRGKEQRP